MFTIFFGGSLVVCLDAGLIVKLIICGVSLVAAARYYFASKRLNAAQIAIWGIAAAMACLLVNGPAAKAPELKKQRFVSLSGMVETIELRPERPVRITLQDVSLPFLQRPKERYRLRIIVRTKLPENLLPGDHVGLSVLLQPDKGPIVPGGYDFSKAARYAGIDYGGFATSNVTLSKLNRPLKAKSISLLIQEMRHRLAKRVHATLPQEEASLAIALTLGLRHYISDTTAENLRKAGLSHLLAISGLHMGLVALISFLVFEFLFAAIPAVALRVMPRKAAVFPVWLVCCVYLLLSGASTSTIRAFIMISVGLLAILCDRKVLTLRSVALAALTIMTLWPHAIMTAGFQLSFAATTGLVAFYEQWRPAPLHNTTSWYRKAVQYFLLLGITSLVAQTSVAPFALYHFQAISVTGIIANLIVLPVVSFFLMPVLLLLLLILPLGLEAWLSVPLEYLLSFVMWAAEMAADLPFSVFRTGPMSVMSFAILLALCGLLLFARFSYKKQTSLVALSMAVFFYDFGPRANVLISSSGTIVAQNSDDIVRISGGRKDSFRHRMWRQYWAQDTFQKNREINSIKLSSGKRFQLADGLYLSVVNDIAAVRLSCAAGDVVVLARRYRRYCRGSKAIFTKEELENHGPLGLDIGDNQIKNVYWANKKAEE